jgi:single-strand DNA-binding protein
MSLNKVMLIGNVGTDPEVRYLDGNTKVATFRLATTERYRDRNGETRENTEWHSIVAWRQSADVAERFIRKGTSLFIEGRLRTRTWTDQQGAQHARTEVTVDNLQLLGRKGDNPASQDGGYAPAPAQQGGWQQPQQRPAPQAAPASPAPQSPIDLGIDSSDDLPF